MVPIAVMEILTELDLLTAAECAELAHFAHEDNYNCHGILAGETKSVFRLHDSAELSRS